MTTMTRERLLSEAEHLMREKGYSVFSYADLSKIVGITKASIHHHFPTKDILGEQVVIQAFSDTQRVFEQIEATEKSAERRIAAYIDIFAQSHKASLLHCVVRCQQRPPICLRQLLYRHHFISICKSSGSQKSSGRAWSQVSFHPMPNHQILL
uniref:TetR/AcrR family transcriptional regulator n=1 Tax=Klebsiella pneumoniae TaxID=573 RepID=UPI001E61472A|nr:TetR/AcrR family transcriptional regulator [Klebsiella pneumoniae]